MNTEDDPEARIRELERTLEEQARRAELGLGSSHTDTVPVPPPVHVPPAMPKPAPYDAPYPGLPKRSGSRSRGPRIIVVVALAFGATVLTVMIASVSSMFSDFQSSFQFPAEEPAAGDDNGDIPIDIVTLLPREEPPPVESAPSVPQPGSAVSIAGVGENKSLSCNDNIVTVSGFSNTVVITGHCARLNVSGSDNTVTVDTTDTIIASGFDNRVTYRTGSPHVTKSGVDNVVEQG